MQKFIIDTDAGVDDAVALAMALDAHRRKEIRVLAITCVRGNTAVENVAVNVLRILDRADCKDVRAAPVAVVCRQVHFCHSPPCRFQSSAGPASPWWCPTTKTTNRITTAGTASTTLRLIRSRTSPGFRARAPWTESERSLLSTAPVRFLRYEGRRRGLPNVSFLGEVSLITLGPLTNVALAFKMDPNLPTMIKEIFMMGGNTEALGNSSICAEFNFDADPESAFIVLEKTACPTYIAPLELCQFHSTLDLVNLVVGRFFIRGPYLNEKMTFTQGGGRGYLKCRCSKGGCVNLVL